MDQLLGEEHPAGLRDRDRGGAQVQAKQPAQLPLADAEPAGQGGWICNVGTGELKVYSGAKSWEAWESTLKGFKLDKEPRTPAPGFGEHAYFLYPKPANKYQSNVAVLVTKSGNHTLALSLDASEGKPAESVRPALESLMKTILARLP